MNDSTQPPPIPPRPPLLLLPAPAPAAEPPQVDPPRQLTAPASPIQLLLKTWLSGFSPLTRQAYLTSLRDFAEFARADSIDDALARLFASDKRTAAGILAAWKENLLHTRGRSPSTVNLRQAAMRSLLEAAKEFDFVAWSVKLRDLKTTPYRDTRGPGLPALQAMLARAERACDSELRARNVLTVRLLFDLGLRGSEVVSLDMADVDLVGRRLWIKGKGRTQREALTLPPPTIDAMKAWIKKRGPAPGPLLTILSNHNKGRRICRQTVFRLIRSLGKAAGVITSPHKVRHTAITAAATSLSLLEAKEFARHSNPATTMRYIDNARAGVGKTAKVIAAKLKSADQVKAKPSRKPR